MKLHYETISPLLKEALVKINKSQLFKDFTLVGGTCLSLQLGHRRSIDIDLFTDIDYGKMNTKLLKSFLQDNFQYHENLESLNNTLIGYSLRVGDNIRETVKIDFFYTEKFIFPTIEIDQIKLADPREIAAMKIGAITQDIPRLKDFWDIHELSNNYSFRDMVEWGIKRNEWTVSENDIIKGFQKIDHILEPPESIDCLKGKYWELVKDDLKELIDNYIPTTTCGDKPSNI